MSILDIVRKGGSRKAILTEQNIFHLKQKSVNRKVLRKFEGDLDERISALYDDLNLISTSEHLQVWRSLQNTRLLDVMEVMEKIIMSFIPMYFYAVKRYKKKIGKYTVFVYWMDVTDKTLIKDKRIFEPSFALRNIRSRIGNETEKVLINAVKHGIVPYHKDKALSELAFQNALRDENKINKLKDSAITPNTPAILKIKKPSMSKLQKAWNDARPILDDLDKYLIQVYNCSFVHPIRILPLDATVE